MLSWALGRIVRQPQQSSPTRTAAIYLQVHADVRKLDGVLFTPGVANKTGMPIYSMEEALKQSLIDFAVLYTYTNWNDPQIQQRLQQAEKSEVLVPDFIPLDLIRNLPNG